VSFALADADDHPTAIDVGDLQAHNLRDAESSGVGRHEDGPMPDAGNRSEELLDLGGAEDDWELGLLLGRDDALHNPVLAERHAVEESEGADRLAVIAP
jgi:hypothetical protein